MLRHYESVKVSDLVTYTKVIKPPFTASPGGDCKHVLNAGQKVCHTDKQDIHMGTQAQVHA